MVVITSIQNKPQITQYLKEQKILGYPLRALSLEKSKSVLTLCVLNMFVLRPAKSDPVDS